MGGQRMDSKEIETLAQLSRLHFEPEELTAFTQEFEKTIAFVNQLNSLDTAGVPTSEGGVLSAPQREDRAGETLLQEKVLQNAPQSDGVGFLLPKVL
jgi:aspartyl-tRNA(Asn)/glutamyl-tRNA(Gln) amidotransferase subunit C